MKNLDENEDFLRKKKYESEFLKVEIEFLQILKFGILPKA